MWQIKRTDELNDDELDEFYCSTKYCNVGYLITHSLEQPK